MCVCCRKGQSDTKLTDLRRCPPSVLGQSFRPADLPIGTTSTYANSLLLPQVSPMGLINCLNLLVCCRSNWIVSLLLSTVCLPLGPITTTDDRLLRPNPTYAGTGHPPYQRSPEARHISSQAGSGHVHNKSDANRWPEASPPALRWAVRPDTIVVQGPVAKLNSAPLLNKFYPI